MNKCPRCGSTNIGYFAQFGVDYCKDCGLDEEDEKELRKIANYGKTVAKPYFMEQYLNNLERGNKW